jgi:hypothetical protein
MKRLILAIITLVTVLNVKAQNTLDKIGLTSSTPATGVYSTRLLSSSYTGPLLRCTIGSNYYDVYPDASTNQFALTSKISAAYTTYNAASTGVTSNALSSVIGSSSATVAIWYDQSGSTNNNNAVQSNSAKQPQIINAGVINLINTKPAVKFLGTTNLVVTTTNFNSDLSGSIVFIATSSNNKTGGTNWYTMNGILSSEQGGVVNDFGYGIFNNKFTAGNGASGSTDKDIGGTTTVNDGAARVYSWTRTNSTGAIALFSNGSADGTATLNSGTRSSVASVAIGSVTTGGSVYFTGSISEITLFASVYSTLNRQIIESNQGLCYGVATPKFGLNKNGQSTNTSSSFINKNGAIGTTNSVNSNGKTVN